MKIINILMTNLWSIKIFKNLKIIAIFAIKKIGKSVNDCLTPL